MTPAPSAACCENGDDVGAWLWILEELGDRTLVSSGLCGFDALLNPTKFKLRPVGDRFGLGWSSTAGGTNSDP